VRELSADLCLSQNRAHDAVRLLGELFERQVNAGDATRASLTYKKLARHGSPTWVQKFRFGQLLEGSNKKLALGTYESAFERFGEGGKIRRTRCRCWRAWWRGAGAGKFSAGRRVVGRSGESKAAAAAFKRVAQLTAESGGRAGAVVRACVSGRLVG